LLLIDIYINKWSTTLTNVARAGTTTEKVTDAKSDAADPGNDHNNTGTENDGTKKKGQERLMGKYRANKS
jgi:hypothetical protein